MAGKTVAVDYSICCPERCCGGVCAAMLECEHGSIVQATPYEVPEINPARWCRGCAKCAKACPVRAIRMM